MRKVDVGPLILSVSLDGLDAALSWLSITGSAVVTRRVKVEGRGFT